MYFRACFEYWLRKIDSLTFNTFISYPSEDETKVGTSLILARPSWSLNNEVRALRSRSKSRWLAFIIQSWKAHNNRLSHHPGIYVGLWLPTRAWKRPGPRDEESHLLSLWLTYTVVQWLDLRRDELFDICVTLRDFRSRYTRTQSYLLSSFSLLSLSLRYNWFHR